MAQNLEVAPERRDGEHERQEEHREDRGECPAAVESFTSPSSTTMIANPGSIVTEPSGERRMKAFGENSPPGALGVSAAKPQKLIVKET